MAVKSKAPTTAKARAHLRAMIERGEAMLVAGRWPTGLPITFPESLVIQRNLDGARAMLEATEATP